MSTLVSSHMLSIVIPDDTQLLKDAPADLEERAAALDRCSRRTCLFFEEKITGFVLQRYDAHTLPPTELYMSIWQLPSNDARFNASGGTTGDAGVQETTVKVTDLVMSGERDISCNTLGVAIWRFSAEVSALSRATSGLVSFAVSLNNPHMPAVDVSDSDIEGDIDQNSIEDSREKGTGEEKDTPGVELPDGNPLDKRPENLLDQLNYLVKGRRGHFHFSYDASRKTTADVRSADVLSEGILGSVRHIAYTRAPRSHYAATLDLPTFSPLLLRVRSAKPAGRTDILLLSLRIEGVGPADKNTMRYTVSGLSVSLKGARVTQLGTVSSATLSSTESLNVSYKISDLEGLASFTNVPSPALALTPNPNPSAQFSPLLNTALTPHSYQTPTPAYTHPDKALQVSVDLRVEEEILGAFVTLVEQPFTAQVPLWEAPRGNVARRANTNLAPPKKVAINNVVSYGYRLPPTALSSPLLAQKTQKRKLGPAHNSSVTVNVANSQFSGLVLTFTGAFSMCAGSVVTWKIQAVNTGRPLQVSLQYREPRVPAYNTRSLSSVQLDDEKILSPALLLSHYLRLRLSSPGVLVLSNDVNLPLEQGHVYETEVTLVGLAKGVHSMAGLKLVESSGESVDVGRMLEVFVT